MELVTLAGVWALAFGHISLNGSAKMRGHQARLFGLVLILVAAYGLPHLNAFCNGYMPKAVASNDTFRTAWGYLVGALAIYITSFVVNRVYPKLGMPVVNLSIKHGKRAA